VAGVVTAYADFLASKARDVGAVGHEIDVTDVHPMLHPWQAELVQRAVERGRCALWEDTGLGKTFQQIEWARLSGATALIADAGVTLRLRVAHLERWARNSRDRQRER